MAQLREFHLQLAFAAARVLREDVENEHRAVDDRHRNDLLEIAALAGTQIVEDEQQIGLALSRARRDLGGLAAADQKRRIDVRTPLDDALHDLCPRGLRERLQFDQLRFDRTVGVFGVDSDEKRASSQRIPSL